MPKLTYYIFTLLILLPHSSFAANWNGNLDSTVRINPDTTNGATITTGDGIQGYGVFGPKTTEKLLELIR